MISSASVADFVRLQSSDTAGNLDATINNRGLKNKSYLQVSQIEQIW